MDRYILLIIITLIFNDLAAQRAVFEKKEIFLGDQIEFILEIPQNIGADISFPEFENDIIEGIEIIERFEIEYIEEEKLLRQKYIVSSFKDSLYLLYPFEFKVDNKIIKSNPSKLQVLNYRADSLLLSKIDTTGQFKFVDIKDPIETPITFKEILSRFGLYILIFLTVTGLFFVIRYFYKKRKDNKPVFIKAEPVIPPHIIALEQLSNLKNKELHKKKILKPFYTELSFIIRSYFENRFHIEALELVTKEIVEEFHKTEFANNEMIAELEYLLSLSDLVKFAKNLPSEAENELMIKNAISFVQNTIITDPTETDIPNSEIV